MQSCFWKHCKQFTLNQNLLNYYFYNSNYFYAFPQGNVWRRIEYVFICHVHNYIEYNQQWNVFSVFNPSKCTHTHTHAHARTCTHGAVGRRHSSSRGFFLKGLTSVVDNSCRSRESNPQPRVTSPPLYPLGHDGHGLSLGYMMPHSDRSFILF